MIADYYLKQDHSNLNGNTDAKDCIMKRQIYLKSEAPAMKKCIVISDSFKGTLSSQDICKIAEENLKDFFPDCTLVKVPVADGGEGTVACFYEACGGELVRVTVQGPYGEIVEAAYLRLGSGEAVVEMAAAAGLPQVGDRKNPCKTSTYGVGQLIRHAVEHGARQVLLGLGGSCTNDGGCGCAAALGVRFYDDDGNTFIPVGETLSRIARIDLQEAEVLLQGVRITVMCDIENPMYGINGAAYVFAPQKGANPEMVEFLDGQLRCLDQAIRKHLGKEVSGVPGAGAAGGFGAGMMAFFGAELKPGIETVLDLVRFEELLQGCDVVFTGEGRLDSQSVQGKNHQRHWKTGSPVWRSRDCCCRWCDRRGGRYLRSSGIWSRSGVFHQPAGGGFFCGTA